MLMRSSWSSLHNVSACSSLTRFASFLIFWLRQYRWLRPDFRRLRFSVSVNLSKFIEDAVCVDGTTLSAVGSFCCTAAPVTSAGAGSVTGDASFAGVSLPDCVFCFFYCCRSSARLIDCFVFSHAGQMIFPSSPSTTPRHAL